MVEMLNSNKPREEIPLRGLNRVISLLEQDDFNGSIACVGRRGSEVNIIADGFGPDGKGMMKKMGAFLTRPEKRGGRLSEIRRRGKKSYPTEGNRERILKKLEEIRSETDEDGVGGSVIWFESEGDRVRVGFEGVEDNPESILHSLRSGMKMKAEQGQGRSPVKSQGPQQRRGKVLDFGEVVGMEDVKEAFREMVIRPALHPELHERYRVGSGGGVLLYGPPGCGKTYVARAAAGELDAEFYHVQLSDLLNKWFGETEERIRGLFKQARREEDISILFFDEIDSLAPERDRATKPMREALGQLLSELDGFDELKDVMVLGATNHPWRIDTAVTRPGRIDRTIFVPPPDREARRGLFRYYTRERPVGDLDYDYIAELSAGFSCADVRYVCEQAIKNPLKEACEKVKGEKEGADFPKGTMEDFEQAIEKESPSIDRWTENVREHLESGRLKGSFPELEEWIEGQSPKEDELEHYG